MSDRPRFLPALSPTSSQQCTSSRHHSPGPLICRPKGAKLWRERDDRPLFFFPPPQSWSGGEKAERQIFIIHQVIKHNTPSDVIPDGEKTVLLISSPHAKFFKFFVRLYKQRNKQRSCSAAAWFFCTDSDNYIYCLHISIFSRSTTDRAACNYCAKRGKRERSEDMTGNVRARIQFAGLSAGREGGKKMIGT